MRHPSTGGVPVRPWRKEGPIKETLATAGRPSGRRRTARQPDRSPGWARGAAAGVAAFYLTTSAWAMAAPSLFFRQVAPFPPENPHFLRDLGAFGIGVGMAALAAAVRRHVDAVLMSAVTTASALHLLSHLADLGDGGNPALDLPVLAVVTAASAAAATAMRTGGAGGRGARDRERR